MTSDKILAYFFDDKPTQFYSKGSVILDCHHDPDGVWLVKDGFVRQYAKNSQGSEVSFHIFKPGAVFPLMWLLSETDNRYAYEAITDVVLVFSQKSGFLTLLNQHPDLVTHFSKRFILGMNGLLTRLESLIMDDVETRIRKLFAYFGRSFGTVNDNGSVTIAFPLTHQDVALWIGAARETTTLALHRLKKQKMIASSGKYYRILSPDILNF